jgi:hypothetical protein
VPIDGSHAGELAAAQKRQLQNALIEMGNAGLVHHNIAKNLAKIRFDFFACPHACPVGGRRIAKAALENLGARLIIEVGKTISKTPREAGGRRPKDRYPTFQQLSMISVLGRTIAVKRTPAAREDRASEGREPYPQAPVAGPSSPSIAGLKYLPISSNSRKNRTHARTWFPHARDRAKTTLSGFEERR